MRALCLFELTQPLANRKCVWETSLKNIFFAIVFSCAHRLCKTSFCLTMQPDQV